MDIIACEYLKNSLRRDRVSLSELGCLCGGGRWWSSGVQGSWGPLGRLWLSLLLCFAV